MDYRESEKRSTRCSTGTAGKGLEKRLENLKERTAREGLRGANRSRGTREPGETAKKSQKEERTAREGLEEPEEQQKNLKREERTAREGIENLRNSSRISEGGANRSRGTREPEKQLKSCRRRSEPLERD